MRSPTRTSHRAARRTQPRWRKPRSSHTRPAATSWGWCGRGRRAAAVATVNLAQADGLTGRARAAVRQARAAIRLARAHRPGSECAGWRALAQAWRVQGRYDRAARAARTALDLAIRTGSNDEIEWARVEVARVAAAAGRWSEVAATCRVALAEPGSGHANGRAVIAVLAGRAAFRGEDESAAAGHLAHAEACLAGRVAPYPQALVEQLRAELAFH